MLVCSQEAFEETIDAAAAASAAANPSDPLSSKYLSHEAHAYQVTLEAHIDELDGILRDINDKGGINRLTAQRIQAIHPAFITPSRPLASYTSDYTKTNFVASQEGLMDTLKTFKDNILKALAALIKKFTDWIVSVFKFWRKENDDLKGKLTVAEVALKDMDRAFGHLADAFNAVGEEITDPMPNSANKGVRKITAQVIAACKMDSHAFERLPAGPEHLNEFFRLYQFNVIYSAIKSDVNMFTMNMIQGDPVTRGIIQNLVLDVQKRLPEMTNRLDRVSRSLVYGEDFTRGPLIESQELVNIMISLKDDGRTMTAMTDVVEDAVESMVHGQSTVFFERETLPKLVKADFMLDTLSCIDVVYLKQLSTIQHLGQHLSGIASNRKDPLPEGVHETLMDISTNLASMNRVMNLVRIMTLSVRSLIRDFDTAVFDEIGRTVKRISMALAQMSATASIPGVAEHSKAAMDALPSF